MWRLLRRAPLTLASAQSRSFPLRHGVLPANMLLGARLEPPDLRCSPDLMLSAGLGYPRIPAPNEAPQFGGPSSCRWRTGKVSESCRQVVFLESACPNGQTNRMNFTR